MEERSQDLKTAMEYLKTENLTCVVCRKEELFTATERGVKPLLQWLSSDIDLNGYSAADKVVGKAAAFLYVLLQVKEVYAPIISEKAVETLQSHGISAFYENCVPAIKNRTNTGFCPMETAVLDVHEPKEALNRIYEQLKKMN